MSRYNLEEQALGAIEAILAVPFDEDRVSYIVKLVILPLIKNMRDVRRYTATIQDTDSSGGKRTIHWTTSDVYTTRLLGTSPKLRPKVPRVLSSLTRLRAFGAAGYDERWHAGWVVQVTVCFYDGLRDYGEIPSQLGNPSVVFVGGVEPRHEPIRQGVHVSFAESASGIEW